MCIEFRREEREEEEEEKRGREDEVDRMKDERRERGGTKGRGDVGMNCYKQRRIDKQNNEKRKGGKEKKLEYRIIKINVMSNFKRK